MGWLRRLFTAKPLELPQPAWDGVHRLEKFTYHEEASWPDDYHSGYRWHCTCGAASLPLPTRWAASEWAAGKGWAEHAAVWDKFGDK